MAFEKRDESGEKKPEPTGGDPSEDQDLPERPSDEVTDAAEEVTKKAGLPDLVGDLSQGAEELRETLPTEGERALDPRKLAKDLAEANQRSEITLRTNLPDREVTKRSGPPEMDLLRQASPKEVTKKVPEPKDSPTPEEEITRLARPERIRKRDRGDEVTRRAAADAPRRERPIGPTLPTPPREEAPPPREPAPTEEPTGKEMPVVLPSYELALNEQTKKALEEASKLDPDKTGKLDGLPPFALLAAKLDPDMGEADRTGKFVRSQEESPPPSTDGEIAAVESESDLDRLDTTPRSTSLERRQRASQQRGPGPRRVGMGPLLMISFLMLLSGVMLGGALVMIRLGVRPRDLLDPDHRSEPLAPSRASLLPSPDPSGGEAAEIHAGADADVQEAGALLDGDAQRTSDPSGELPEVSLAPIGFRRGGHQIEEVDEEEVRRIGQLIAESSELRVELVGFCLPEDGLRPVVVPIVAERRAEEALELLRAQGASRRRFTTRAARAGEPFDLPDAVTGSGLIRGVVLRVTRR